MTFFYKHIIDKLIPFDSHEKLGGPCVISLVSRMSPGVNWLSALRNFKSNRMSFDTIELKWWTTCASGAVFDFRVFEAKRRQSIEVEWNILSTSAIESCRQLSAYILANSRENDTFIYTSRQLIFLLLRFLHLLLHHLSSKWIRFLSSSHPFAIFFLN